MNTTDSPTKDRRRNNYANLPVTKPYKAPPSMMNCWKCGAKIDKLALQEHLNRVHPNWQHEAIRKMGIHLVNQ